ncbi:MAG: ATP-binding protein [Streptosporangiaceae bacterium]|nr:ATP-binding protein [Streptosporangiaceae bacterium]
MSAGPPILDQAFDAHSLRALRSAMAAHASAAGLARGRAEDVVIAVHELAANVVRHGLGHGRLRVWHNDGALCCEISEDGDGRAAHAPQPSDVAQWRILPGHGLWLVRQLADRTSLGAGPSGTIATLVFGITVR